MKTACRYLGLSLAIGLITASGPSSAQDYPNKLTTIVVAYAAGGGADVMARILAQKLSERLGHPVIVENKPGGNGIIGATMVAKSAPDGYTLLAGMTAEMILNAAAYPHMSYDPVKDFEPITKLYSNPLVFAVHPSVKAKTMQEFIALAKTEPGKLDYASGAAVFYLAGEMLNRQAGVNVVRIPYKGSGATMKDVIGGHVSMLVTSLPSAMGPVQSGTLRGLAVTSLKRDALLPDLPTMEEVGLKNFDVVTWAGLYAPHGTPRAVVDRLNREMAAIVKLDDVKKQAKAIGVTLESTSPEEQGASQRADIARFKTVIEDLNINLK
jgi:tripartite-type tricarboxylate transporter receptor subunit TctC